MPATKRAPVRARAAPSVRQQCEYNAKVMSRISKSLDAAQEDLASVRGSLGSGARDIRRDVSRLLRDTRREVTRMSRLVMRDLEALQKDLAAAASVRTNSRRTRARRPTRAAARR